MHLSPLLALAGLLTVGLLATRLPRFPLSLPHSTSFEVLLAGGAPLVVAGLVLGPGIDLLRRPALDALAPVTALAIGWIGAALGARAEWRVVRRIARSDWVLAGLAAGVTLVAVALSAWLLTRAVPALARAWTPRLPAILTLGAVAAISGPGAVALVARAAGVHRRVTRRLVRAATLETACGALAVAIPLALHGVPAPAGRAALDVVSWVVLTLGSGVLVALVFLSLSRESASADTGFALFATMLFGAGIGWAARLSPFVVCMLAAALIVNRSPRPHAVRRILAGWGRPLDAVLLLVAGAVLTLPTVWILGAVLAFLALRVAAAWAAAHIGRLALRLPSSPQGAGLGGIAQGLTAIALGANFLVLAGGAGSGTGGAMLTTIVLGVAAAQLVAPPLMKLAPLTPAAAVPELSANAPVEGPR